MKIDLYFKKFFELIVSVILMLGIPSRSFNIFLYLFGPKMNVSDMGFSDMGFNFALKLNYISSIISLIGFVYFVYVIVSFYRLKND